MVWMTAVVCSPGNMFLCLYIEIFYHHLVEALQRRLLQVQVTQVYTSVSLSLLGDDEGRSGGLHELVSVVLATYFCVLRYFTMVTPQF